MKVPSAITSATSASYSSSHSAMTLSSGVPVKSMALKLQSLGGQLVSKGSVVGGVALPGLTTAIAVPPPPPAAVALGASNESKAEAVEIVATEGDDLDALLGLDSSILCDQTSPAHETSTHHQSNETSNSATCTTNTSFRPRINRQPISMQLDDSDVSSGNESCTIDEEEDDDVEIELDPIAAANAIANVKLCANDSNKSGNKNSKTRRGTRQGVCFVPNSPAKPQSNTGTQRLSRVRKRRGTPSADSRKHARIGSVDEPSDAEASYGNYFASLNVSNA